MNNYSRTSPAHSQSGFTLIEWLISIVITLFLTAGLLSIFVASRQATSESIKVNERQENGIFAMQILARDLKHAYFFGLATGIDASLWSDDKIPAITTSDDCIDSSTLGSFPSAINLYRPLWASTIKNDGTDMNCLDDGDSNTSLIEDSDYISVKKVRGLKQTSDFDADAFYLDTSQTKVDVYKGDPGVEAWEYRHHVYYLDTQDNIPRLRRLTLSDSKMQLQDVIVEGIEDMQFMFALDNFLTTDRTGSIDSFVGTSDVTSNDWNTGRVIGMKIFLLARSATITPGYTNDKKYQLGDTTFTAPSDGYKRSVISQVIYFPNSVVTANE